MTDHRIIYPNQDGRISIIIPTGALPIKDVALKDVPAGVPFVFTTADQIPSDRTFRDAWQADFSNPDGTGVGADAWFDAQESDQ